MTTKVQKWGNSYGLRLPKALVKAYALGNGTPVIIETTNKGFIVKPQKSKKPTLEELVSRITPENRHDFIDWGGPVGSEMW